MSLEKELETRSGGVCELCGSSEGLSAFEVAPSDGSAQQSIYLCSTCKEQIENPDKMNEAHFNCLNDSMWSETPAVAVMSYRLLKALGREDLVDMMYMEDDIKAWADSGISANTSNIVVKDSNGVILNAGDSVVIIKDLEVKGAGFTAKRGTTVRNISIPSDVEGHIEGRVNGTKIYLKTEFLKKA
ncbi:MAG: PhnA domain protein [Sulfurimonas sp. RIFOXYD12_FULL_33_39]|uniref:PhnA domain-containing protein n=1 Tax=unclassified Sulfurimonas TaxID=2623549 RepID=UPI0008ACBD8A|nr:MULTISPECIES: alkylphosphonate utilization protein [unclassified Sulfurimonas]OHE05108.1 MAG: PhnA domain protein [Sulfurimonas sp. RIFCSPLOWO2_12_FULL_34_6]OHE10920.1 MAG: PhnA domain protein [Sulfurimonas sp. RIFOXYD12_FULL_33_39]OHE13310.1 MAG: PhnA domain protein [Sulfurimonas sp. RIFOXYD2_FULL_34_21]